MNLYEFHEVDEKRWSDLEALFEARGGPKYCWCMAYRANSPRRGERLRPRRKAALRRLVKEHSPIGILAYRDGKAVGWCSVAPRETYRDLGGPPEPAQPGKVWSVVCFFVPRSERRQGLMRRLLTAAEKTAKRHGAAIVEAYPVDSDSPSYRFMGYRPVFEEAGYREVGRAGSRRHVVRLSLRRPDARNIRSGKPRTR